MIELEKTYLARELPKNLTDFEHKEIMDIYIPKNQNHPTLRIRKNGASFEITKKAPVTGTDSSKQKEDTIILTEEEFLALQKTEGKKMRKFRYRYPYEKSVAEFDVFQDDLAGLVLVDVEFETEAEKDAFEMPNFCLADVTQDKFVAGGMLCGKKYSDIENELSDFRYKKLYL